MFVCLWVQKNSGKVGSNRQDKSRFLFRRSCGERDVCDRRGEGWHKDLWVYLKQKQSMMFSLREGAVKGFSVLVTHATDCPVLFLY